MDIGFPTEVDLSTVPSGMGPEQIEMVNAVLRRLHESAVVDDAVNAELDARLKDGRIVNVRQLREVHDALQRLHVHREVVDAWQQSLPVSYCFLLR